MSDNLPELRKKVMGLVADVKLSPEWVEQRDDLVSKAKAVSSISNKSQYDDAGLLYTQMGDHIKTLESIRKAITKPLDDAKKILTNLEKTEAESIENERYTLKQKLAKYAEAEQRRIDQQRRDEEAARIAEIERQEHERAMAEAVFGEDSDMVPEPVPVPAVVEMPQPKKVQGAFTSVVETLDYEIMDEGAVPRMFFSLDERKLKTWLSENREQIKAALKTDNGIECTIIPGCRIKIKTDVRVR